MFHHNNRASRAHPGLARIISNGFTQILTTLLQLLTPRSLRNLKQLSIRAESAYASSDASWPDGWMDTRQFVTRRKRLLDVSQKSLMDAVQICRYECPLSASCGEKPPMTVKFVLRIKTKMGAWSLLVSSETTRRSFHKSRRH